MNLATSVLARAKPLKLAAYSLCAWLFVIAVANAEEAYKDAEDCYLKAQTTPDYSHCASLRADEAKAELAHYLGLSIERIRTSEYIDPDQADAIVEGLLTSQREWESHLDPYCDAIYWLTYPGSSRNIDAQDCRMRLSQSRTLEVWNTYLRYHTDVKEPVLNLELKMLYGEDADK